MFAARGWRERPDMTAALRQDLEKLERATWLRGNSFILEPIEDDPEA